MIIETIVNELQQIYNIDLNVEYAKLLYAKMSEFKQTLLLGIIYSNLVKLGIRI